MDRLDRLLIKAKPKPTMFDKLKKDNPYLGMSLDELLNCMCPHIQTELEFQENTTPEYDKFIFALVEVAGRSDDDGRNQIENQNTYRSTAHVV